MREILTERPNLFEPNAAITFCVKISSRGSAEDLASAVKSAYEANESTTSRIVLKSDGTAFYEKLSHSGCKVEIIQNDWQEIIRKNEKIPFDLKGGELVRSFVIPYQKEWILLIMAHHLAGDGKAIVYLIESIMKALSGSKLEYKPLSLLTRKMLRQNKQLPFLIKLYIAFRNKKWQKMGSPVFTWEDYNKIHSSYWKKVTSYIQCKKFSVDETARIKERAKQLGVSVNSYIVTAFLQADRRNRVVGIPVSIRGNGDKSMTNLTSGISITHCFSEKNTFAENAGQVHRKINSAIGKKRWFVLQFVSGFSPAMIDGVLLNTHNCCQYPLLKKMAEVMGYTGNAKRDLGITNLTILDIPMVYGENKIEEIIFVPPAVSYSENIIGVLTAGGEMMITYHGTVDKQEKDKDFFHRGVTNLEF